MLWKFYQTSKPSTSSMPKREGKFINHLKIRNVRSKEDLSREIKREWENTLDGLKCWGGTRDASSEMRPFMRILRFLSIVFLSSFLGASLEQLFSIALLGILRQIWSSTAQETRERIIWWNVIREFGELRFRNVFTDK